MLRKNHPTPNAFASLLRSTLPLQGRVREDACAGLDQAEIFFALAASMASQIFDDVIGISRWRMP